MKNSKDETSLKRSVLLGARMRFSPAGANVREEAIQRILEQNLAAAESTKGLTEAELRKVLDLGGNMPILRASDVTSGIERLKSLNRIIEVKETGKIGYVLSLSAKAETEVIIKESEERYESVLKDLFKSAPGVINDYKTAFLKLLCLVFSRLGDVYVKVIAGTHVKESFAEHQLLSSSIDEVLRSESVPDTEAFKYATNRFFRESSPKFDSVKWNMAQNYYITKALGIDEAAQMLSADILKGASFYLDTNVLIAGLIPEHRHHGSFQELFGACKTLNIKPKVTRITLEELKNVVSSHAELVRDVYDKIPGSTRSKVRSFLLEPYLVALAENPNLPLEEFLAHFRAPIERLQEVFDFELVDDEWFDRESRTKATDDLARELSLKYEQLRNRPKNKYLSIHDALLLRWVSQENESSKGKCWAVTLDLSLITYVSQKMIHDHTIIMTLDALLQWTTPQCAGTANEDRLAEIYSQAIKYQLLPREVFFDLRDFQVFADMDIETSLLPAEDVESCIRDIQTMGASLDPSKAEDREKIARTIQRYFVDPGTKYRKELERLIEQNKELTKRIEAESQARDRAENRISELSEETNTQREEIQELRQTVGDEQQGREKADKRLSQLEQIIERRDREETRGKLRRSTVFRMCALIILLFAMWGIIGMAALKWGAGDTVFQKLANSAWWFAIPFAGVGLIFPFVLGRERIRLLKWWRGEDVNT